MKEYSTSPEVDEVLNSYLKLGKKLINPPGVEFVFPTEGDDLVGSRDFAIASARQCYFGEKTKIISRLDDHIGQEIADSTLDAGHHTTRMHSHFSWLLSGVTRHVTWEILHSYPFYNTEQQSQRYVEAKKGSYLMPADLSEKQSKLFEEAANFSNESYFQLLDKLKPAIEKRLGKMYEKSVWSTEKGRKWMDDKAKKLSQEIARYVLPLAQHTTMIHTLNELQLLRLWRASKMNHFSDEARFVIASMVKSVSDRDPSLLADMRPPLDTEIDRQNAENYSVGNKEMFDELLFGGSTILINYPKFPKEGLILAGRGVLNKGADFMSDDEVLAQLLNPVNNPYLADIYDVGINHPLSNVLRQFNVQFATKMSHTADSQRQRHRRTPGSTPPLSSLYSGEPDYETPLIIKEDLELEQVYDEMMDKIYQNVEKAIDSGISSEYALLLLPNAHSVRVVESGDLFDWAHRWKQRLCYLAQEEIFFVSVEQVKQVLEILPEAENLLLAPCGIRSGVGIGPKCPEGDRFCGVRVWDFDINEYEKSRFI